MGTIPEWVNSPDSRRREHKMEIPENRAVELPRQAIAAQMRLAMRLSVGFGIFMLLGKVGAYLITGSAAILSDAAESVIHVVAVSFAAFSLWLSSKPPDRRFPFGYERITFFSAGFEGALIMLAAIFIIYSAIEKWIAGLSLANLGAGTLLVLAASLINAGLGWYLLRVGRRSNSLILEANGKHVLTDSWTSFGVVGGLGLVMLTGWKAFDPLCAIAVALNILWSGGGLVWRSVGGLMDYSEPAVQLRIQKELETLCSELGVQCHAIRIRSTGSRLIVHVHLLFPYHTKLGEAHKVATEVEERLPLRLEMPAEIVTHLEAIEDHSSVHRAAHFTGED
jgi:cation diffusion facilitator family transporter